MRYAISYVSTAERSLSETEIRQILNDSEINNNKQNITGLLLYSEGNFFQIIEGDQKQIVQLYDTIEDDSRHFNVIKLFGKEINKESFDGYKSDFISEDARYSSARLQNYEHYLEVLDKPTKNAVANILKAFIV
ncbi:BLUF domain-containing protein [Christiangramia sp. LLG6405-1]|uniref:BLUF domain-containing protein n=1 Tax=Christiangramia sp. LLG6405-1 TaxID=3160832 RepID=UPI00386DE8A2